MTEINLSGISATSGHGQTFTSGLGSPLSAGSDQQWDGDRDGDDAVENMDINMDMDITPAPPMQMQNHKSKVLPLLLSLDESEGSSGRGRVGQRKGTMDPRNSRIIEKKTEKGSKYVVGMSEEKSLEVVIKGASHNQSNLYPAGSAVQFARNKH